MVICCITLTVKFYYKYKSEMITSIYFCLKVKRKMGENNSNNPIVTELGKLEISSTEMTWSAKVKGKEKNYSGPSGSSKDSVVETGVSEFKIHPDPDRELSELQCPFTWHLPRSGVIPSEKILSLIEKDKELEEDEFKIRK